MLEMIPMMFVNMQGLTLCAQNDFSFWFDTINLGLFIINIEGSQIKLYFFL